VVGIKEGENVGRELKDGLLEDKLGNVGEVLMEGTFEGNIIGVDEGLKDGKNVGKVLEDGLLEETVGNVIEAALIEGM